STLRKNLKLPVCSTPNRNRTSILAPLASGVTSVMTPTPSDELNAPPFGCCPKVDSSRSVPRTSTLLVPLPQGGRSTVTVTSPELRARRSAMPLGAGNVVVSITRKRKRVTALPLLFVIVLRTSNVPKVELLAGSLVKSRTRLGGDGVATQGSS